MEAGNTGRGSAADTPTDRIGVILLGAGVSRRFGGDKRLHPMADGTTISQTTLRLYRSAFSHVRIVVRPNDPLTGHLDQHIAELTCAKGKQCEGAKTLADVQMIVADKAHLGMGHSLAAGARDLSWDAAFVGLLDMPFVRPETLARLQDFAGKEDIVVPEYHGRVGHPVAFGASFFADLRALVGDRGAKLVMDAHPEARVRVPVDDPGVLQDIDRPGDLANL